MLNSDEVISGQAMSQLAINAQSVISVIWYDTRPDPANHLLDVWGTTSTDGGQTFSPNFRLTDQAFDADQGVFTDAIGQPDYYLGDHIGLALTNDTAYGVWTTTGAGNQDIVLESYALHPAPTAPNDRYEPNNTPDSATDLGKVVQSRLPKLALPPGDEDWFRLQAGATGELTISADSTGDTTLAPDTVQLQLWDASGTDLLATNSEQLNAVGDRLQELVYPGGAGQTYLVRVLRSDPATTDPVFYGLDLESLTADLGMRAFADLSGILGTGGEALYRLTAAAAGSLQVQITNGTNVQGNLTVQVLDPQTFAVLSDPPLRLARAGISGSPGATSRGAIPADGGARANTSNTPQRSRTGSDAIVTPKSSTKPRGSASRR